MEYGWPPDKAQHTAFQLTSLVSFKRRNGVKKLGKFVFPFPWNTFSHRPEHWERLDGYSSRKPAAVPLGWMAGPCTQSQGMMHPSIAQLSWNSCSVKTHGLGQAQTPSRSAPCCLLNWLFLLGASPRLKSLGTNLTFLRMSLSRF